MAKRSARGLSKKGIVDLVRIRKKDGKRVWMFQGKEYENLRQVVEVSSRQKAIATMANAKKNKGKKVESSTDK